MVPRNNPVDAYTMAAIVRDAGLTIEQFKDFLLIPAKRRPQQTRAAQKGGSDRTVACSRFSFHRDP